MKKIVIATFAVVLFSASAKASGKSHKLFVPSVIESSFDINFPGASNPAWSLDEQFMKATFIQNSVTENAYFSSDGDLVATTKAASFSELPEKAQQRINAKYKDYKVEETIQFVDNDPETESNIYSIPDTEINYFVSLTNGKENVILDVNKNGDVAFYEQRPEIKH
ncbi:hypothetical protein QTN47_17365 [Danxiaibacter flavus]|uniref:Beta-lactamase-inhibitor-like PepSY-like domain-containing protein n=1 Tax=Danxiaibacter flavus TaxID=3049108 RepID=A0ABV3ZHA6_9BACT|nr:hypothetical protein QNM32_17375 [Chitinophagaceae bacterium DXS]